MSAASTNLDNAKAIIRSKNLEADFLKIAGLDSLDELSPANFPSLQADTPPVKTTPAVVVAAAPVPAPELTKQDADAKPRTSIPAASDMLGAYLGTKVTYASRKKQSHYQPSSIMMYHIIHLINNLLVDNYYFKRYCPDYHPYVLRLYFGVVFYVQVLRAGHQANALDAVQHEFLTRFISNFPLESLPLPGPLVVLFKTICTSQPEISAYGKIYPTIPSALGPATRDGLTAMQPWTLTLPQVPAIFALLEDLNAKINDDTTPTYPKKGKHTPVAGAAVTFGHHAFNARATRSTAEAWSLVTPGLEYPCEADAKLNEAFAERYDNFGFPTTAATDITVDIYGFLSMRESMSWFCQVVEVASAASLYFEGSGSLADCSPNGLVANQFQVRYSTPATLPTLPTQVADKASRFPFAFRLSTTARSPPALAEAMAACAQTHIRMFGTHPYMPAIGSVSTRYGQFWDIRPIETSSEDEESVNALPGIVKKMMKSRV